VGLQMMTVEYEVPGLVDGVTPAPPLSFDPASDNYRAPDPDGIVRFSAAQMLELTGGNFGLFDPDFGVGGTFADRFVHMIQVRSQGGGASAQISVVDARDPNLAGQEEVLPASAEADFFTDRCVFVPQGSAIAFFGFTATPGQPVVVRINVVAWGSLEDYAELLNQCCCMGAGPSPPPNGAECNNILVVNSQGDLPAPVGSIIQLPDDTIVQVCGMVDLGSDVLRLGTNTVLKGNAATLDGFMTANASLALVIAEGVDMITSELALQNSLGAAVDFDGQNIGSFLPINTFFLNSVVAGTVRDAVNAAISESSVIACQDGFILDGSFVNVAMSSVAMLNPASPTFTGFEVLATASILAMALLNAAIITNAAGQTGLDFAAGATYVNVVQANDVFVLGPGTPLAGVTKADPRFNFKNCVGILDSVTIGNMVFTGNLGGQVTVITVQGAFVRIGNGNAAHPLFVANPANERFSVQGATTAVQVLRYDGLVADQIPIRAFVAVQPDVGGALGYAIRLLQNGLVVANTTMEGQTGSVNQAAGGTYTEGVVTASPGDTFAIEIANLSGTQDLVVAAAQLTSGAPD
jgi:hypothetical protein